MGTIDTVKKRWVKGFLGSVTAYFASSLMLPAIAQVVPDGTLPTTVTTPNNLNFTIDGGTRSGTNLFHSFGQFSVPIGGSAIFNNPTDVQNIFSRVTGGSVSNINGMIQAQGSANLFLLNPAGILFGANASLNIGGSFIGTTANSLKFADGAEFSAMNPNGTPLLTISVPVGLQMGQNPGTIAVQGTGHRLSAPPRPGLAFPEYTRETNPRALTVQPGRTLALVGGNVTLTGGQLVAEQGRIELASVGTGLVNLAATAGGFALNYDGVSNFQDIRLSRASLVDTSGSGGSGIHFAGRQIALTDGSLALIQNSTAPGGTITVRASEALTLTGTNPSGTVRSLLNTESIGIAASGAIQVSTNRLVLNQGGQLSTRAFSSGVAGNISVNASDSIDVLGSSPISPTFFSSIFTLNTRIGSGRAGDVNIATRRLTIRNGGIVTSSSFGNGPGGDLTLNATELVEVTGRDPVFGSASDLNVATNRSGNAGSMTINTRDLVIRDGGRIRASTIGSGNAGDIIVNASRRVEVSNNGSLESAVSSPTLINAVLGISATSTGRAGGIRVNTDRLTVSDAGQVTVRNIGPSNGGILEINANSILLRDRATLNATTVQGEGGNILIRANNLVMRRGSSIITSAGGNGNGGNITIAAPIIVGLENSNIIANAVQGRGGDIQITTQGMIGLQFRPQLTPDNDITASSEFGVNGTVQINNIGVDLNSGLIELPGDLVDATQQIAKGCQANQGSSFIISGRGGVPINPAQQIRGDRTWADLRDLSAYRTSKPTSATLPPSVAPIVEATHWHRNPQTGKVELYAAQPADPGQAIVTCAAASY